MVGMVCATAPGCDSADSTAAGDPVADSFQDDDIPMGDCDATDGVCPSGGSVGDGSANIGEPCDGAVQCQSGVCAATFADSEPGALSCQPACIEVMDSAMWCSDSATCCGNAVCTPRGFCVPDGSADGESSGDSGGDSGSASTGGTSAPDNGATGETGGGSGGPDGSGSGSSGTSTGG